MRKLLLLFIIASNFGLGQSSIELNFNDAYIGKNFSLDYRYDLKSIYFKLGVTYHINRIETLPEDIFYRNAGYATNTGQHFGLQFGGGYTFYENEFCDVAIYYKGYMASMNTYIKSFKIYEPLVANPQSEEDYALIKNDKDFGPIFTFENTVGITISAKLFSNVQLTLGGGLGHMLIRNKSNNVYFGPEGKTNKAYVFTSSYYLGLRYTLNKRSK